MRKQGKSLDMIQKRTYECSVDVVVMNVLVIAGLFPPDMGAGSTRAFNVVKDLFSLGHRVTVVTAFPHYPMGKIPNRYRGKLLSVESVGKARVFRVWVPSLVSRGLARRLALFLCFCFSCFFALPFVERVIIIANRYRVDPRKVYVAPAGADLDISKAHPCGKLRLALYLCWRSLFCG